MEGYAISRKMEGAAKAAGSGLVSVKCAGHFLCLGSSLKHFLKESPPAGKLMMDSVVMDQSESKPF